MNNYIDTYINVLRKYAVFGGRAPLQEYWKFMAVHIAVYLVLAVFGKINHSPASAGLYSIAVFLPALGVTMRRLHDTGRTGWWSLITIIPLIGLILLLVFTSEKSQPGTNQYGVNPGEQPQI